MPPDTTYHIAPHEKSLLTTITFHGGRDTDIYLLPGELPPGVDSTIFLRNTVLENPLPLNKGYLNKEPDHYIPSADFIFIFLAFFIYVAVRSVMEANRQQHHFPGELEEHRPPTSVVEKSAAITIEGDDMHLTDEMALPVLQKHFPYFNRLSFPNRQKFLQRLKRFAAAKTFKIHDEQGFKEMPILVSATAIQLSFGLDKYLLPGFPFIHIYPEEFLGIHPNIRYLEGNVSARHIRISWKHFLQGFQYPADGQNVGLHEMAHAYYYQNMELGENVDDGFMDAFPTFNINADKVFSAEKLPGNDLYSDYALKNSQEFWAGSIELFFEKPEELKAKYRGLYDALCGLLNQDPAGS